MLFAILPAFAQSPDNPNVVSLDNTAIFGSVIEIQGSSFTVLRGSSRYEFFSENPDTIGFEIRSGDIIQTSDSTFLEIALYSPRANIQIADNSSFSCSRDATGFAISGELYYGRVRARVATLLDNLLFTISTPSLVGEVSGSDVCCDVLMDFNEMGASDGRMVNRLFCPSGSVRVSEVVDGSNVIVNQSAWDERVSHGIEITDGLMIERIVEISHDGNEIVFEGSLTPQPVSREVDEYWRDRPMQGFAMSVTPSLGDAVEIFYKKTPTRAAYLA